MPARKPQKPKPLNDPAEYPALPRYGARGRGGRKPGALDRALNKVEVVTIG